MKISLAHIRNGIGLNIILFLVLWLITYFWYFSYIRSQHSDILSNTLSLVETWENLQEDPLNNADDSGKSIITAASVYGDDDFSFIWSSQDFGGSVWFGGDSSDKITIFRQMLPELTYLIEDEENTKARLKEQLILDILSQPEDSDVSYIDWITSSFQDNEIGTYMEQQKEEIWEIIPTFVAHNPNEQDTSDIPSKVTLKTLINYVHKDILDRFGIALIEGALGITNIQFDEQYPQIGYYTIAVDVPDVHFREAIKILDFVNTTGDFYIESDEEGRSVIEHTVPTPTRVQQIEALQDIGQSGLSNLLIELQDLTISPVSSEEQDGTPYMSLSDSAEFPRWQMSLNFTFYIRGASGTQVKIVESQIDRLINGQADLNPSEKNIIDDAVLISDNLLAWMGDRIDIAKDACSVNRDVLCGERELKEIEYLKDLQRTYVSITNNYEDTLEQENGDSSSSNQIDKEIDRIQDRMKILGLFQSIDEKLKSTIESINADYEITLLNN